MDSSSILHFEKSPTIIRRLLKFKKEKNGLLLKIHHTIETEAGTKRIRFSNCAINFEQTILAIDQRGNAFVFNLSDKTFWQLPAVIPTEITVIKFVKSWTVLVGNKSGFVIEIDIYTGNVVRSLKAFSSPVIQIHFPTASTFVVASSSEVKSYDFESFSRKCQHVANSKVGAFINLVELIPGDDKIVVCMSDNSINVLTSTLKVVKTFLPLKLKEKFLLKGSNKIELLDHIYDSDEASVDKLIKTVTHDYCNGTVKHISFSSNGKSMTVTFLDNTLAIISTMLWDVKRIIKFPDLSIIQSEYIQDQSAGFLLAMTSNDSLLLLNLDALNVKVVIEKGSSIKFALSRNGRVLCSVLETGEIYVYNLEYHLGVIKKSFSDALLADVLISDQGEYEVKRGPTKTNANERIYRIENELSKTLPKSRLLPILKEFGQYPEAYRPMIWKTILKIPLNHKAFSCLLQRGAHCCTANYNSQFPLSDFKDLNNLKKILSCVAHWSKIFGHVEFLPTFLFPFLKVFRSDSITCFEVIATILLNHCQLLFEFTPLEPFNFLGIVENVMTAFEPKLMNFYHALGVTAKVYAMALIESAFSEVFDTEQWLALWDHILSNDPYFLVFCIVGYSSINKTSILKCQDFEALNYLFHDQNHVNFKKYIKRCYSMMERCSNTIHPRRYIKPFVPLLSGSYQKFTNFPKNLLCVKALEIDSVKEEQRLLDGKINELELLEQSISERMQINLINDEHEKRMKEVELKYEDALLKEETRLAHQRKLLILYQRKIRQQENEMLIEAKNSFLRKSTEARESELENLMRNLEKERIREETELQLAEEGLKIREMEAFAKQLNGEMDKQHTLANKYQTNAMQLDCQRSKFMQELNSLSATSIDKAPPTHIRPTNIQESNYSSNSSECSTSTESKPAQRYSSISLKEMERRTMMLEQETQKMLRDLCEEETT